MHEQPSGRLHLYGCVYMNCAIIDEISSYIRFSALISTFHSVFNSRFNSCSPSSSLCVALSCPQSCFTWHITQCFLFLGNFHEHTETRASKRKFAVDFKCLSFYLHRSIVKLCWCSHISEWMKGFFECTFIYSSCNVHTFPSNEWYLIWETVAPQNYADKEIDFMN